MVKIKDGLEIHFPLKLKPRDQQLEAIQFTKDSINNGKRNILLNLTTGSGKSYYAMMFMNWYKNYINKNSRFDILTNSKILQTQYTKEFPLIKDYRGRVNFYCDKHDMNCALAHETHCKLGAKCEDCPYEKAKKEWQASTIGLTNFHLFNTIAVYVKSILDGRDSHVLIVDEAHDFESVFCDFISVDLCSKTLKRYGFDLKEIEDYERQLVRLKNIGQFVGFVKNQFITDIINKINWLDAAMAKSTPKMKKTYGEFKQYCETAKMKFDYLIKEFEKKPDNWILESSTLKNKIILEAKPVWGNDYIKEKIFDKYDHVIFMSGTILDKELFSYVNGLEPELTTYLELPTSFDIKRHPLYYIKCGKMTYTEKQETFKKQIAYIDKILKKYPDKKGVIHCNSYEFNTMLQEQYVNKRLLFHTPENRDEMLEKHINADYPSVIVSPSMVSGVDFKDELSRFQIILKVPFPFLGSNKVKRRMETNKKWYPHRTVCDLIQMCGRSMRSHEDYCNTFILDSSLSDLLKYNGDLLPRWFSNSIKELKL